MTTEAAGTAQFSIVLTSEPTANVTDGVSSNDTSEGTVSPASVVFTPANWSTPQPVTVTGVNDAIDDANVGYSIVTAQATSTDGLYAAINPSDPHALGLRMMHALSGAAGTADAVRSRVLAHAADPAAVAEAVPAWRTPAVPARPPGAGTEKGPSPCRP